MTVPESSRLAWLEGNDIAERAAWVTHFREGDEPLGQIVQTVMGKRGAHWDTPIIAFPPEPPPLPFRELEPAGDGSSALPPRHVQQPPPTPPTAVHPPKETKRKQVQQVPTRDRATPSTSAFCPDFNRGMCNSWYSCDKGIHSCSKLVRQGNQTRFCGSTFHGAHDCATIVCPAAK